MSTVYKFSAEMTCNSCSNCITRVLEKHQKQGAGIESFSVNLESREVIVKGTISLPDLMTILNKTGINIELLSEE